MSLYLYDGAVTHNYAAVKQHGVATSHYMANSYEDTSFQVGASRAAGLGALQNMEGAAAELKGATRKQGQAFAERALVHLAAGTPRDGTVGIPYSVDTDLTNLTVCDEAFRGINDVHASSAGKGIKVMVYGEGGLIERLHGMGLVQGKQWLSMSTGFGDFTHALRSGLVGIVQMHDAQGNWIGTDIPSTDRNTILDPINSGIWWPDGSPYHPATDWLTMASLTDVETALRTVLHEQATEALMQHAAGLGVLGGSINLTGVERNGVPAKNATLATVLRVLFSDDSAERYDGATETEVAAVKAALDAASKKLDGIAAAQKPVAAS